MIRTRKRPCSHWPAVISAGADALTSMPARLAEGPVAQGKPRHSSLDYAIVRRLKAEFPAVPIAINGALPISISPRRCSPLRRKARLDGVMLGRAAYQNPGLLLAVDPVLFGQPAPLESPLAAGEAMLPISKPWLRRHRSACAHPAYAGAVVPGQPVPGVSAATSRPKREAWRGREGSARGARPAAPAGPRSRVGASP